MTVTQQRIKEMNEAGYSVFITHRRILKETGKSVVTYNNNRSKCIYGPKPEYNACGGSTIVHIGMIAKPFVAECSKKDHFCFKDGTFLAVSRAYAYFKEHCVKSEQGAAIQQEVPQSKSCCGGKCCSKGETYEVIRDVLKEKTMYHIVCFDPDTNAFVGYVPKNDLIVKGGTKPFKGLSDTYSPSDYTNKVGDIADFETQEAAEKCRVSKTEKVVRADYKLVSEVTVTEL